MSKTITYRQCKLSRKTDKGRTETVSWLPSKFAKVGRVLDLKGQDDNWTKDWTVELVSDHATEDPPNWRETIKAHRRQTGDSLPKQNVDVAQ